jgi:hypothetical protein
MYPRAASLASCYALYLIETALILRILKIIYPYIIVYIHLYIECWKLRIFYYVILKIKADQIFPVFWNPLIKSRDRYCDLAVRVPGYGTEMYFVPCEVRTEFIYVM